jgi:hypothetical protein
VTDRVNPASHGSDDTSLLDGGHLNAQVHAVDQITVTGDGRGHLLTEADGSGERLLNGLRECDDGRPP